MIIREDLLKGSKKDAERFFWEPAHGPIVLFAKFVYILSALLIWIATGLIIWAIVGG
jgi:hypothetical protein